jgi:hypothetical protein
MDNLAQKLGNVTAALAIGLFLLLIVGPIILLFVGCTFWGACP